MVSAGFTPLARAQTFAIRTRWCCGPTAVPLSRRAASLTHTMGRHQARVPSDQQRPKLGYMPGLDGLRAAALLAVLFFHEDFTWAKGGYLGVTTFFVLSGFLITSLLLVERRGTGKLNLGGFWARRLRRLAPALLVLVALVAVLSAVAPPRSSSGMV